MAQDSVRARALQPLTVVSVIISAVRALVAETRARN